MRLIEALEQLKKEHLVSFHMPGHKNGRLLFSDNRDLLAYDITEIPGADHLHDAEGCILETEMALTRFYGSERTRMLVGGSTVGILSAIMGATDRGDLILINRNAHKSVYNAIEMHGLSPVYLYPQMEDYLGIPLGFDASELKERLDGVKCALFTYPTYEGVCYDLEPMIRMCHEKGIPVIVDEAHGAHLLLHRKGPKSALLIGADVVIQSFHKTMPAMTQTACLHFSEKGILTDHQRDRIDWYLKSLQSSSPSYVLMASIDNMLTIAMNRGVSESERLEQRIEAFHKFVKPLKNVKTDSFPLMDVTKIILSVPKERFHPGVWDGDIISKRLREDYGIQSEYATKTMVLLMASFLNTNEDFDQLEKALSDLDARMDLLLKELQPVVTITHYDRVFKKIASRDTFVVPAHTAVNAALKTVTLHESVGEVSGSYVIPYPPGIPVLVPGERIIEETLALVPEDVTHLKVIIENKD